MDKKLLIHEFEKNALEKVKVELGQYNNNEMINIRVFFKKGSSDDDWIPTRKGITMSSELIPDLKQAIDKAYSIQQEQHSNNH